MGRLPSVIILLCCVSSALFSDPSEEDACVIELSCAECVPDHMPWVSTHAAAGGRVTAPHGDEVTLACGGGGRFLAYPLLDTLTAVCEGGRLRVRHDNTLRHLLELGCQEDIFEDVQHPVEHCGSPYQGRAYQTREVGTRGTRHLATLCFDSDRGLALWAHASNAPRNALRMAPHEEKSSPLTLFGNFNHMFDSRTRADAERLFADSWHMTRRLQELLKHEGVTLAGQALAAGPLLAPAYFDDQNMRVTNFVSNQVPVWTSVAAGNLHHLHQDVARYLKQSRPRSATVDVYAGTHGVLSMRTSHGRREVFLRPGRFPVPQYLWTVVHDTTNDRALALVLLNDPFVSVSEVRERVFCESACGRAAWLHALRRQRRYEAALYGLVFCCDVHNFTALVPAMPKHILKNVPAGNYGMLTDSIV